MLLPLADATGQPPLLVVAAVMTVALRYRRAISRAIASLYGPASTRGDYGILNADRQEALEEWHREGGWEPAIRWLFTLWASACLLTSLLAFAGILDALLPPE